MEDKPSSHQTVSTMRSLLVAILLFPDVQKKAQEELDSVIGRERLPTIDDRSTLPFIDAVCKETLRWRPVTPLGAFSFHNASKRFERHHMYNIVTGRCPTCNHKR
jgi:cytochrome P450